MPLPSKRTWPKDLDLHDRKVLQRALNDFIDWSGVDLAPLIVDGKIGAATRKRIKECKWLLGINAYRKSTAVTQAFVWRLGHPRYVRRSRQHRANDAKLVARGVKRRVQRRAHERRNRYKAKRTSGVGTFDGKPCAHWLIPYLQYARDHDWEGRLNSGWRDPAYSERLCYEMCGRPSCPGRCAGRASGHSQDVKPRGCVDVSDYERFGRIMRDAPFNPKIFNALGAQDPVHFSASGR